MKTLFVALATALFIATPSFAQDGAEAVYVKMTTNQGDIVLQLDPVKAPKTVENFLRYVNEGFYDGTVFHRVIGNFMIQGGGYTELYQKKPTHEPIENEADNMLPNKIGSIAMARTAHPHSATAQFFINVVDNVALNHTGKTNSRAWGYTVFGEVISGMDVVDAIRRVQTGASGPFPRDVPMQPMVILSASVIEEPPEAPAAVEEVTETATDG